MESLLPLIILLPFFGALIIGVGGLAFPAIRQQEKAIGTVATLLVFIPFFILLNLFINYKEPIRFSILSWMQIGAFSLEFSYVLDQLSLLMGLIVTGVGGIIHLYSIGYMHGDKGFYKYFAYLNLFIFAMNNLVMADNLLVTFLGWEGVGACSYFLIGFWYKDMMKAKAAQKAFVVNRIGDFAFIVAMLIAYHVAGSLKYEALVGNITGHWAFWMTLLLFIAATGKSAQIPLYVWLPDAMAGPTPVSALIHAATMVTAGIYLIARMSWVYIQVPEVLMIIGAVSALTALLAASIAIAQNDIKKVLAYSTVSQLGYMFMGLGAGAFAAAIFHLMTHAFFKACLFLGSGSVIHAMEHTHAVKDPQDIRTMGGLRKYLPSTSITFWIATLAIAGIPPLAGFFSKDEILSRNFFAGHTYAIYYVYWLIGVLTAFLTAFYMTRLSTLTFEGKPRFNAEEHPPHESPAVMTIPLWILAIFSIIGGFFGLPELFGHGKYNWITHHWLSIEENPLLATQEDFLKEALHPSLGMEIFLITLSIVIALLGVFLALRLYKKHALQGDELLAKRLGKFYNVLQNKYYVDELYERIIVKPFVAFSEKVLDWIDRNIVDGVVDGTGESVQGFAELLRRLQTGIIQNYALLIWLGVILLLAQFLFMA